MSPLVLIIVIDVITLVLGLGALAEVRGFRFVVNPLFAAVYFLVSSGLIAFCAVLWAGTGAMGSGFAMLAIISLSPPVGILLVAFGAHHLTRLLTGNMEGKGKVTRTCGKAEAAERDGRAEEAEEYYRQALLHTDNKPHPEDAPIHLAFGDFLKRQGRNREAVKEWQEALCGDLPAQQCQVTALRATELLTGPLKKPGRAAELLQTVLERCPDGMEAEALRARLAALRK